MLDGREAAKKSKREGGKKVLHFKCPFPPPHDAAALGEI